MTATGRAPVAALLAGTLLVGALLTACAPEGAPSSSTGRPTAPPPADGSSTTTSPVPSSVPSPVPTQAPDAPEPGAPTAEAVRAGGTVVTVDGRTVLHALAAPDGAALSVRPDGEVAALVATPGAPGTPVAVLLAAPAGGTLALQDDGSVLALAADGTFLGGAARPVVAAGGGPVAMSEPVTGVVRATAEAGPVEVRVGARAVAGAEWGEREGGRSLAVSPTPWARAAGQAGEVGVWTELVAAVPEAGTPVMRDQLTCHALGAPDKETWNLEPWRPDVGLLGVLAAACNPE